MKNISVIIQIISFVIAGMGLIPITVILLRRMLIFGGIDLLIFAFVIIGWIPNMLMVILAIAFFRKTLKGEMPDGISVFYSAILIAWSLFVIAMFMQNKGALW